MNAFFYSLSCLFLCFSLGLSSLQAQAYLYGARAYKRHTLSVGYGMGSLPSALRTQQVTGNFPIGTTPPMFDQHDNFDIIGTGVISLGYTFDVSDRLFVGIEGRYEHQQLRDIPSADGATSISQFHHTYSVTAKVGCYYLNTPRLKLYGSVAAGYGKHTFDETEAIEELAHLGAELNRHEQSPLFAWQATPIGVRYGNRVSGFAELGVGHDGGLKVGLSVGLQ